MKKVISYTSVFVVGFLACGLALGALRGDIPGLTLPGAAGRAQQAVLTSLNSTPTPAHRFVGDSVVADAAAKLEPAIVTIHVKGKPVVQARTPYDNDPVFRQFFGGRGGGAPVTPEGAGSGVIISPDGYILTNNHVIADMATVTVNVGQGDASKEYTARVIGADPMTDIAVVKIDPQGVRLRAAELGDSDAIRVGDWALAVGNPLDIGTTVTLGIVSAKDRKDLQARGQQLAGTRNQTDAAINPGNSGGALANINGQVIGINEAILSPTGSYIGIGLAIPINDAKKIAAELIRNGHASHPYLGIQYGPVKALTTDDRQQVGIPANLTEGVVVRRVYPNSPAAQAGLHIYDVVLQANGQKIEKVDTLNDITQSHRVGDNLTLLILRDGQQRTLTVTLRERPDTFGQAPDPSDQGGQSPDDQPGIPLP